MSTTTDAREELAQVLRQHRYKTPEAVCTCSDEVQVGLRCDNESHEQHAAGVLLAAGYRKPRVITTLEELKTVYEGAILKDAEGEMWGIDGSSGRLFLVGDGNYDLYDDTDLHLPATVVYEEPEDAA